MPVKSSSHYLSPLRTVARTLKWVTLLLVLAVAAWAIDEWVYAPQRFAADGQRVEVADGDSFAIGTQKFRLDGIDAPEYLQTCQDATGTAWNCGKSARVSLERYLKEPGLRCAVTAADRYGRLVSTCATGQTEDIGAEQVRNGLAVSHAFYGVRSYGIEEDTARVSKAGIWAGAFMTPSQWRKSQLPR